MHNSNHNINNKSMHRGCFTYKKVSTIRIKNKMVDSCGRLCPCGFSRQGSDVDCSCTPHRVAIGNKGKMAGDATAANVSYPLPKTTKNNDKQTLWKLHHLSWFTLPFHWAQFHFLPLDQSFQSPFEPGLFTLCSWAQLLIQGVHNSSNSH